MQQQKIEHSDEMKPSIVFFTLIDKGTMLNIWYTGEGKEFHFDCCGEEYNSLYLMYKLILKK